MSFLKRLFGGGKQNKAREEASLGLAQDEPQSATSSTPGGIEQALASRYATLPALLWMGLFATLALLALQLPARPARLRTTALALLLLAAAFSVYAMYGREGKDCL